MRKARSGFEAWVEDRLGLSLEQALCNVEAAALALRGYGFYLYEQGFPRYLLVYAITAVQDIHPAYRSHLTPAWQVDKKWQAVEPGECRPVISQPIVCAAVSTSLLWEWYDWAAVTIIGFLCMMHPAEFVFLRRSDLVFPSDALSNDRIAYVHIRHPKTARFARRQHCRLEDPVALTFLESLYLRLPWDARLFRGSPHVYRSQWNAVMSRLQVPHTLHEKGATPGVLRGSGATFLSFRGHCSRGLARALGKDENRGDLSPRSRCPAFAAAPSQHCSATHCCFAIGVACAPATCGFVCASHFSKR